MFQCGVECSVCVCVCLRVYVCFWCLCVRVLMCECAAVCVFVFLCVSLLFWAPSCLRTAFTFLVAIEFWADDNPSEASCVLICQIPVFVFQNLCVCVLLLLEFNLDNPCEASCTYSSDLLSPASAQLLGCSAAQGSLRVSCRGAAAAVQW